MKNSLNEELAFIPKEFNSIPQELTPSEGLTPNEILTPIPKDFNS